MNSIIRPLVFACLLAVASQLSHFLVYKPYVLPLVSTGQAATWWGLLLTFLPNLTVCSIATFSVRNIWEGMAFCIFGGLFCAIGTWFLKFPEMPIDIGLPLNLIVWISCFVEFLGLIRYRIRFTRLRLK